jgi:hypothetical protein
MSNQQSIPWVEKYRPTQFDDIVLDKNKNPVQNLDENSCVFLQIIKESQPMISNPGLPTSHK